MKHRTRAACEGRARAQYPATGVSFERSFGAGSYSAGGGVSSRAAGVRGGVGSAHLAPATSYPSRAGRARARGPPSSPAHGHGGLARGFDGANDAERRNATRGCPVPAPPRRVASMTTGGYPIGQSTVRLSIQQTSPQLLMRGSHVLRVQPYVQSRYSVSLQMLMLSQLNCDHGWQIMQSDTPVPGPMIVVPGAA